MDRQVAGVLLSFGAGAVAGAVGCWLYLKKKYEEPAPPEAPSEKAESDLPEADEVREEPEETDDETYEAYSSLAFDYGAQSRANAHVRPRPIDPCEFGEAFGYETVCLTYFADGVLAYDDGDLVEDVDGLVGEDFSSHFGEYEEDAAYFRNDRLACDVEVLRDVRRHRDLCGDERGR